MLALSADIKCDLFFFYLTNKILGQQLNYSIMLTLKNNQEKLPLNVWIDSFNK